MMFTEVLAAHAMRNLEQLGVQVWTNSRVTNITDSGVQVGEETIQCETVLWAAGVQASPLGKQLGFETDRQGRILVNNDLSVPSHPNIFVAGDMAHFKNENDKTLPGVAPVAMQQGLFFAKTVERDIAGKPRETFHYQDKGQMATIGRSKAIVESGNFKVTGFFAWIMWLVVHIYYLTGFRNRLFVVINWAWSYLTFRRGARLIVEKEWRSNTEDQPA